MLDSVIDGHNDLAWASRTLLGYGVEELADSVPSTQTDLPRLAIGGVAGQFWSVWVDPVLQGAEQVVGTLEQIDFVHRLVRRAPRAPRLRADRSGCAPGDGGRADRLAHRHRRRQPARRFARGAAPVRPSGRAVPDAHLVADDHLADSATDDAHHGGSQCVGPRGGARDEPHRGPRRSLPRGPDDDASRPRGDHPPRDGEPLRCSRPLRSPAQRPRRRARRDRCPGRSGDGRFRTHVRLAGPPRLWWRPEARARRRP